MSATPDDRSEAVTEPLEHVGSPLCGCPACSEVSPLEWDETAQGLQARYSWDAVRPSQLGLPDLSGPPASASE